jgi:chromosome segregation ATPase
MISQRDIIQFFNIVDILSNPDKIKAELAVIQNLQNDLGQKSADLAQREAAVNAKEVTANTIIAKQTAVEQELSTRSAALDDKAKSLAVLEDRLAKISADHQRTIETIAKRTQDLNDKKQNLDDREEKIVAREQIISTRMDTLQQKEQDYAERIKKLRGAIL